MFHSEAVRVLTKAVEAFNELANDVNSRSAPPRLSLSKFCRACRLLSPLIGCMGIAFRFADMEFSAKVGIKCSPASLCFEPPLLPPAFPVDKTHPSPTTLVDRLTKASESIDTIEALIDLDIARNAGKGSGSNSRNLIRANRSVDLVRILFEQILAQRGNSITGPLLTAYGQVFGPYHSLAIKTAVRAAALTIPTKAGLLRKLKENEASSRVSMQKFVSASSAIIQYINNLFHSTEYGDDW
ncbi:hypothetical protein RHSIM_Rhsim09G0133000 [Rhododendron simsii]|uniref:Glycolipid transfer protein domain-containing protein n=1 Tax=Rhododendron simsii TaxID=118357 RepID=A0A834LEB9_RHOSS|nr:hypothetical protein RHSIM_Rhsim09G0133000 [Rhododendron simsii]